MMQNKYAGHHYLKVPLCRGHKIHTFKTYILITVFVIKLAQIERYEYQNVKL